MQDASQFTIGFDHRDRDRVHKMWEEIFDSQRWSEGQFVQQFETLWADQNGLLARAFSGWAGGALAALNFIDVQGETVLCPSNTFMATVNSVMRAGGKVQFVDCNREDLCLSYEDFVRKAEEHRPKAAWLAHIGGHIAFDSEKIAAYCKDQSIWLLEDCAHAHGASWNGKRPGQWGDAGVYSFYATKTVSTGEGGMLVSDNEDLISFAEKYRNWGKFEHEVEGLNFRMNEFTAVLGVVQAERLEEIITWKNEYARSELDAKHPGRLRLPDRMTSGLYKYIVFDEIEKSTGKVYDQPCHRILGHDVELPNSDWVADNHWCVPLYYQSEV
jgi:dTDP-4-amino-4,6-dideoxygalactose transaminase